MKSPLSTFSIVLVLVTGLTSLLLSPSPLLAVEYEVEFNATWSAATHPGAYPANAHFSPLIGATHTNLVSFWQPGGISTPGIESMAETGATSKLRNEFLAAGANTDTIIQGSGIPSPGSTTTSFDIEASHSLVTLVTMVAPSPDWFLGVSGLDLHSGGSWAPLVTVDLFSYDSGTDAGPNFTSPNNDITPHIPIALLGAPFTGANAGALGTFTFTLVSGPNCDFEPDGDCDIDDVDLLVTQGDLTPPGLAAPPADAKFDLDGDNDVDTDDYNQWLTDAATVNGHASAYRAADTDLDRDVDITDFNNLATNFDVPGVNAATNGMSKGNTDADNDVDITDFNLLASTFSPGGYDGATDAAMANADPGQVDLVVDLATGEIVLEGNAAAISGLQVFSAGNSLLATDFTAEVLQFVISTNASTYAEGEFVNTVVDGQVSLGILYDLLVDAKDLTFEYTMIGQPTITGDVIYVPEPSTLMLLALGIVMLRRRCGLQSA